jgi:hypothetical protein
VKKAAKKEEKRGAAWLKRIESARKDKARAAFTKAGERSYKVYKREETDGTPKPDFPIWWSTVTVMKGQLAAQVPKPDIRERFPATLEGQPPDPMVQAITKVLERSIDFLLDTEEYQSNADRAVLDWLVSGLGVARLELHSDITREPLKSGNEDDGEPEDGEETEEAPVVETVARQSIRLRFHPWARFLWDKRERWEDVEWIAFEHAMTARQLREEYKADPKDGSKSVDGDRTFEVFEIWDKRARAVRIVAPCCGGEIDAYEDPLKLAGFWPMPPPLMENIADDDLCPKSNYDYIAELDRAVQVRVRRIMELSRQIKDVGFYDAQLGELGELTGAKDGTLIAVQDLATRLNQAGGAALGFGAVIAKQDNTAAVQTVQTLLQLLEQDKQQIYETIGISDITRGTTDPNETKGAQQIKAQFANIRNGPRARQLAYWWRGVYRIAAEIVCEHITDQQVYSWTGIEVTPEMRQVMRSDVGRTMLIDVETDATMAQDDDAVKQSVTEIAQALTQYLQATQPMVAQGVIPADSVKELLLFFLSPYKRAKPAIDAIQAMPGTQNQLATLQQQLQQAQQQMQQLQQQLAPFKQGEQAVLAADAKLKEAQAFKNQVEARNAMTPEAPAPEAPPEDRSAADALAFAKAGEAQAREEQIRTETAMAPAKFAAEQVQRAAAARRPAPPSAV